MKRIILTGETGSGKTYKAINEYNNNKKFIYLAPCRQLVYESFIEYSEKNDILNTGETKIGGNGSMFAVYESFNLNNDYTEFDSIIIDEAHFINDVDRGNHLWNIINKYNNHDIYLVTATDSLDRRSFKNFEHIHLKAFFKTPKKVEIDVNQFYDNIFEHNMFSIHFCRTIDDCYNMAEWYNDNGINAEAICSATPPAERLRIQYDFKRGKIQVVCSTNILAQGVNFPAENILLPADGWNTDELIHQKLGRLGRYSLCKREEVYYATEEFIPKKISKKRPSKVKEKDNTGIYVDYLEDGIYENGGHKIVVENGIIIENTFPAHEIISNINYINPDNYTEIRYVKNFVNFIHNFISCNYNEIILTIKETIKFHEESIKDLIIELRNERQNKGVIGS